MGQTEVHAAKQCARINKDRRYNKLSIVLLSNSQAAIKALISNGFNSSLTYKKKLTELNRKNTKRSTGVIGYEKVGELARLLLFL